MIYNRLMKITKTFAPKTPKDWRRWLEKNHDREQEVWLVYFKPASGKTGIDYETSVEEALCFGWIDSIIQKMDDEKYARKFNPRRMDSQWSESNRRRVAKIIREGRMTEAGMAKVTFDVNEVHAGRLKAKRPAVQMSAQIEQAIRSRPGLWEAFQNVTPSLRRTYILWLTDAKKAETFERRLNLMCKEVMSGRPTAMH